MIKCEKIESDRVLIGVDVIPNTGVKHGLQDAADRYQYQACQVGVVRLL